MRNLKFLFISFFLILISATSSFAASIDIQYEKKDGTGYTGTVSDNIVFQIGGFGSGSRFIGSANSGSGIIGIDNSKGVISITASNDFNTKFFYKDEVLNVYNNDPINDYIKLGDTITLNVFSDTGSIVFGNKTFTKAQLIEQNNKVSLLLKALVSNTLLDKNKDTQLARSIHASADLMLKKTEKLSQILSTKNYEGFTSLNLSLDYMDPSLNVKFGSYTGACNGGKIVSKTLTTQTEINNCAKQIAKKIIDASDFGVNRFMSYNSNELNKRLIKSYDARVNNRKLFTGKLPVGLTGALADFTIDKYDYFNDPNADTLPVLDFTNFNFIGNELFKANIAIELAELKKAKEFKNKFDNLKTGSGGTDPNINAKLTVIFELTKIDFGSDILRNSFYTALSNNIQKLTTADAKVEQKFIFKIDPVTVMSNKDYRLQALKKYINGYKNSTDRSDYDLSIKNKGVFFMKDPKGNWVPNLVQ